MAIDRRSLWWKLPVLVGLGGVVVLAAFALDPFAAGCSGDRVQADDLLRSLRSLAMPLGKAELPLTLALLIGVAGGRRRAAAALLAAALAGVVVGVAKPAIGRSRPHGEPGAFPSGDSAALAAVATPLVLETPWLWPVAGAVVAAVGGFRVLDGMHYPSDVIAGAVIGVILGLLAWMAIRGRRRLPSWRFFAIGAGVGLALHVYGAAAGGSERFLIGLVVFLPPAVLVVAARFACVWCRRARGARPPSGPSITASLLGLMMCWTLASGSTLWDRDEPRFARAAVEMLESGDWLVPTFNGLLRPDKPAGIYWLMASSIRAFGPNEWAVRMWSGLGVAAAALLAAGFVRRHLPSVNPAVVVAVLVSSPLVVVVGSAATTDGVLLALVTAAAVVAAEGCLGGWPLWRVAVLGALLGAGLLVKGPVAFVVPGALVASCSLHRAREHDRRWLWDAAAFVAAAVAAAVIFLAWALPANRASGGVLAAEGVGRHLVARSLVPLESHGGPRLLYLPYYPLVLFLGMMPWSAFLPAGVVALWRAKVVAPPQRRLIVAWIVPMLALLTLVATKLPHYLLPVLPAAAMVIAVAVAARRGGTVPAVWWSIGAWSLRGLGTAVGVALVIGAWWQPVVELRRFMVGVGSTVTVASWLEARLVRRRGPAPAVVMMLVTAVVVTAELRMMLPVVESLKPAAAIARAVRGRVAAELPVAAAGFREPSLAFYLGRRFTELADDEVARWLGEPAPGVLIATTDLLPAGVAETTSRVVARVRGYNYVKGDWVDVVAILRSGDGEVLSPASGEGVVHRQADEHHGDGDR